jgi:hypothetical protein
MNKAIILFKSGIGHLSLHKHWLHSMFVEIKVHYSAFFTNLVGWHVVAVSFPLSDLISAQLAFTLNDDIILFTSGIANLSLHKHWLHSMFVDIKARYSALFTNLVVWHAVPFSLPPLMSFLLS